MLVCVYCIVFCCVCCIVLFARVCAVLVDDLFVFVWSRILMLLFVGLFVVDMFLFCVIFFCFCLPVLFFVCAVLVCLICFGVFVFFFS